MYTIAHDRNVSIFVLTSKITRNSKWKSKVFILLSRITQLCMRRVWGTDQIVIPSALFQQRDLFSASYPFTAGFPVPPLFRQSQDRRY